MKSSVAGFQPASVYVTMHPGALPQALLFQPFRLFYYFKEKKKLVPGYTSEFSTNKFLIQFLFTSTCYINQSFRA